MRKAEKNGLPALSPFLAMLFNAFIPQQNFNFLDYFAIWIFFFQSKLVQCLF